MTQNRFKAILMAHEMKGTYRVFVMVGTHPGHDEDVAKKLLEFEEIIEVHFISGMFDLLAVVEVSLRGKAIFTTIQEIAQFIIQKIRRIDGIRETNTLLPLVSLVKKE
jgi:DNA-binding Lrp family transcriptional regulator